MVAERIQVALCLRPLRTEKSLANSLAEAQERRLSGDDVDDGEEESIGVFKVEGSMVTINPLVLALADEDDIDCGDTPRKRRKFSYKTPTRPRTRRFTYDKVYAEGADDHKNVYTDLVEPLVETVLSGRNGTVLAYGSTGSGKTHTIFGGSNGLDEERETGVVFKLAERLFEATQGEKAEIRLTFVELYNGAFRDLLSGSASSTASSSSSSARGPRLLPPTPSRRTPGLRRYSSVNFSTRSRNEPDEKIVMRQDRKRNVFLMGTKTLRTRVKTAEAALKLIRDGCKSRQMAATRLNARSSRSHSIITFEVHRNKRVSKLRIVDLAGSERLSMTGVAHDPVALAETQSINLSLSTLASVLSILSKPDSESWLAPYRDSKLTMILRDSLGGNSRTVLLTHARQTPEHVQQTLVTLAFAARAKRITNNVIVNHEVSSLGMSKNERELRTQLDEANRQLGVLKKQILDNSKALVAAEKDKDSMSKELTQANMFADPKLYDHCRKLEQELSSTAGTVAALRNEIHAAKTEAGEKHQFWEDEIESNAGVIAELEMQLRIAQESVKAADGKSIVARVEQAAVMSSACDLRERVRILGIELMRAEHERDSLVKQGEKHNATFQVHCNQLYAHAKDLILERAKDTVFRHDKDQEAANVRTLLTARDDEINALKAQVASLKSAEKIKSLGAVMGAESKFAEKIKAMQEAHKLEIERLKAEHKENMEYVDTLIPRRSDRVSLARIEESNSHLPFSPGRAPMSPIDPNSASKSQSQRKKKRTGGALDILDDLEDETDQQPTKKKKRLFDASSSLISAVSSASKTKKKKRGRKKSGVSLFSAFIDGASFRVPKLKQGSTLGGKKKGR